MVKGCVRVLLKNEDSNEKICFVPACL
jgi:hypothetical protein